MSKTKAVRLSKKDGDTFIGCRIKELPGHQAVQAAAEAIRINPLNSPRVDTLSTVVPGFKPTKERLAILTGKIWHSKGVQLTVRFLDIPESENDLKNKILSHMNAWGLSANVKFAQTSGDAYVRIARTAGDGYWSNLGTDLAVLLNDQTQPTLNLDSFTLKTPDSEFYRVVRHETGHTLGFPHEHMRREVVNKIDKAKAYKYFNETQGWSKDEIDQQVLTPLDDKSLIGTLHADVNSIMCYFIPGSITKDGKDIPGGIDIDKADYEFAAKIYPK